MNGGDVWVDLLDPDEATLRAVLPPTTHEMVMAQLVAPLTVDGEPRPYLRSYGSYVMGVLLAPALAPDGDVWTVEVDVVVTVDRLVTVRKTPPEGPPLDLAELRSAVTSRDARPGLCLYHVVDEVAEAFLDLIDHLDEAIDRLEEAIEDNHRASVRQRIAHHRGNLLRVRRWLSPTRDAARAVLDDRVELEGEELFPHDVELRFADAYDKFLRATEGLDLARDLLAGVRDYHQAQIANDQNDVMKRLTAVASLLLLPTFIVGLYGQNLQGSPEMGLSWGYALSWIVIIVTTIGQLVYFRRKKWI